MSLQAIKYARGSLELLDQRLLPHEFTYLPVRDVPTSFNHIKDMVVRGAPAIGVTGVLTIAVDLVANKGAGASFAGAQEALAYVQSTADYLVTSRPTAVNLRDGLERVKAAAAAAAQAPGATAGAVVEAVVAAAEAYFDADIKTNKVLLLGAFANHRVDNLKQPQAIGSYGAEALLAAVAKSGRPARPSGQVRVLTHCNTGSLATAGYGTALGVIRALHEAGKLEHAYCTETRPYNQGARLTAFELQHEHIPATLVCDSATAYLLSSDQVDAIVVGADRVVANGDTANKIGTYMLSVIAAHHKVPFFIAAPTTTLDPHLPNGALIEIEQRPAEEITHFKGQRVVTENIKVWNPSFDVAPGTLIAGIVTELGVIPRHSDGTHQVEAFLTQHGLLAANGNGTAAAHQGNGSAAAHAAGNGANVTQYGETATPVSDPKGFFALDEDKVKRFVAERPELAAHVGPPSTASTWTSREVGDGNINFVYILQGPAGGLAVKQSLPYVRCVGESWQLTQDRVRIEAEALGVEAALCPQHVPQVFLYDKVMALIAMEYVAPPAIILRRGLIQGVVYPHLAEHVAEFLAQTLFGTSIFAISSKEYRERLVQFKNPEMCELTEKVIFTEPYTVADNNRHNAPHLDADVAALQADVQAKVAISALKRKFVTSAEVLLHGDLHTGSIMVTQEKTYMIDPEFAFYGPAAFDVAKILSELLIAIFASHGQELQAKASRQEHREWLAGTTEQVWELFQAKFLALWDAKGLQGDLYPAALLGHDKPEGAAGLKACQEAYFETLWVDTVSYIGAFIIRRLVGIAHTADMDTIEDAAVRAGCERRALLFGRLLLVAPQQYASVRALVAAAVAAAHP